MNILWTLGILATAATEANKQIKSVIVIAAAGDQTHSWLSSGHFAAGLRLTGGLLLLFSASPERFFLPLQVLQTLSDGRAAQLGGAGRHGGVRMCDSWSFIFIFSCS